jgi:signal transduction histidine kinase
MLEGLLVLAPDGLALFDSGSSLTLTSPVLRQLFGEVPAPGTPFSVFMDWLGAQGELLAQAECGAFAIDNPTLIRLEDGSGAPPKVIQCSVHQWADRMRMVCLRDVTRWVSIGRLKTEFLVAAAQEIRTPMTTIHGMLELLATREMQQEQRLDVIDTMHRQSRRLVALLNSLLDVTAIDTLAGASLKLMPCNLESMLIERLAALSCPSGMTMDVNVPMGLPKVLIDRALFGQALDRLLSHACASCREGGTLRVESWLSSVTDSRGDVARQVVVAVSDDGPGHAPDVAVQAFQPFLTMEGSCGLGLSMVQEAMDRLGGHVEIRSQWGIGTTISLYLPAMEVQPAWFAPLPWLKARHTLSTVPI